MYIYTVYSMYFQGVFTRPLEGVRDRALGTVLYSHDFQHPPGEGLGAWSLADTAVLLLKRCEFQKQRVCKDVYLRDGKPAFAAQLSCRRPYPNGNRRSGRGLAAGCEPSPPRMLGLVSPGVPQAGCPTARIQLPKCLAIGHAGWRSC